MRARYSSSAVLLVAYLSGCSHTTDEGYALLFLGRSPAARVGRLSWAPDAPHSRLIAFDGDLHVVRTISNPRLSSPAAVATFPNDRLLVTERTGEGVVWDTAGNPVREWESPFPASLYATDGDRIVAARSGDVVYFAPLVRDEILRLDAAGSTVWRSSRGLVPTERDPHFAASNERRVVHALVNIAMSLGPDGRIYVLGAQDSAATELRLDVLRADNGEIVASRRLGTATTAIAVDRHGHIRVLDPERLLAQTPTMGRDLFSPAFALPDLSGKIVRLADFRGKVTLVNFWASWCAPCREEFPHMAELYREFRNRPFAIAAISDDVSDKKMRAFVREFRPPPPFPVLVGEGRMKAIYHYRGLPYSVLLDRNGRIIERIFGFGGDLEFSRLRATITRELDADSTARP